MAPITEKRKDIRRRSMELQQSVVELIHRYKYKVRFNKGEKIGFHEAAERLIIDGLEKNDIYFE